MTGMDDDDRWGYTAQAVCAVLALLIDLLN
jgi:hypothetical protein